MTDIFQTGTKPDTAPFDETGTPDHLIEECTCGVPFRVGEEHRCGHVGEWVSWERYQNRQAASGKEVTA